MLKETETEETIGLFVTSLSLVAFQLGENPGYPPPWLRLCCITTIYYVVKFKLLILSGLLMQIGW